MMPPNTTGRPAIRVLAVVSAVACLVALHNRATVKSGSFIEGENKADFNDGYLYKWLEMTFPAPKGKHEKTS